MSKNQAIQKMLHKSGLCIRKYSPVALSCVASVGVVVTAVAAVKATPKAVSLIYADSRKRHDGDPYAYSKKEAVAAAWKCYIPAVAIGASTIACIMGANALNRRQQAALTSAYALVQQSYKEYKDKLKELYGEEAHNAIVDSIAKEKCTAKNTPLLMEVGTILPSILVKAWNQKSPALSTIAFHKDILNQPLKRSFRLSTI